MSIQPHDLMDAQEVAAAFDVTVSSLSVAMSKPDVYSGLADRLPAPIRKIGNAWVWRGADVEAALEATP